MYTGRYGNCCWDGGVGDEDEGDVDCGGDNDLGMDTAEDPDEDDDEDDEDDGDSCCWMLLMPLRADGETRACCVICSAWNPRGMLGAA